MLSRLNFVFVAAFLMAAVLVAPLQAETIVLYDDFEGTEGLDLTKWSKLIGNQATITQVDGFAEIRRVGGVSADRAYLATVGQWIPAVGAKVTVSGTVYLDGTNFFDVWLRATDDTFDTSTTPPWNGVADSGVRLSMHPGNHLLEAQVKNPGVAPWTSLGANVYLPSAASSKYWDFVITDNGTNFTWTVTQQDNSSNTATFTGSSTLLVAGECHVLVTGYQVDLDEITITQVPEPSTLALLVTGLIGLLCYAWRKRK